MTSRGLDSLKGLKAALKKAREEEQACAAIERERLARQAQEGALFSQSVGRVTPLPSVERAATAPPRPAPEPKQRQKDERAALRETLSDEFNVDSLLETDEALLYRSEGIGLDVVRKLRRGVWVIQTEIDLHGLRTDEAREQLALFIREAVAKGMRCVRVVHGKGHGSPGREPVLKARVRGWLVQKSEVLAFVQARPAEGGSGALVVLLKAASTRSR